MSTKRETFTKTSGLAKGYSYTAPRFEGSEFEVKKPQKVTDFEKKGILSKDLYVDPLEEVLSFLKHSFIRLKKGTIPRDTTNSKRNLWFSRFFGE